VSLFVLSPDIEDRDEVEAANWAKKNSYFTIFRFRRNIFLKIVRNILKISLMCHKALYSSSSLISISGHSKNADKRKKGENIDSEEGLYIICRLLSTMLLVVNMYFKPDETFFWQFLLRISFNTAHRLQHKLTRKYQIRRFT
jgi:hypothetical protein